VSFRRALVATIGACSLVAFPGAAAAGEPNLDIETDATETFISYQAVLLDNLIPSVQSLPGYVDGYFDHANGSGLVVQFEEGLEPDLEGLGLVPAGLDPSPVVESVPYSADDIQDAILTPWETAPEDLPLYGVAYDAGDRAIVLQVAPGHTDEALAAAPAVSEATRMQVEIEEAPRPDDTACSTRATCYSPMKGGIQIRRGSTSGALCTMGFHVQVGTDEQFVTAGHCGYSGSNAWYHAGYPNADCSSTTGCVGFETATQYGTNGRDIMRVQMNDSQDSNVMWALGGSSDPVGSAVDPMQGMWTCVTKGVSQQWWQCGWLSHTSTSWTSTTCGCVVVGARTAVGGEASDSGSPIVVGVAGSWRALGILNTNGGHFARVQDALSAWGITIRL
jgi:hypothetical protein